MGKRMNTVPCSPNLHENWDWSVCKRIQVLCCSFCYKRKIMLQIYKNFRILYGEMMFIFCNLVLGVKEKDSNEHSLLFLNKNLILIRYNYS